MTTIDNHTKTPGWLDYYADPSRPRLALPRGAVDAHCHVFGPGNAFPYSPQRKYTPCDASKEALFALHEHLGFQRSVIVQASCHGTDNRALVDALLAAGDRARGIAVVAPDVSDAELHALNDAGVRGVRFNFLKRLANPTPYDLLLRLTERVAKLGWHVVVYFEGGDLPQLEEFITKLPTVVVVDHMGRPDVDQPVDGPEFGRFLRVLQNHDNIWVKVSGPERLTKSQSWALPGTEHPYPDVIPFARRLVETVPDRVLWGTDWPHPNLKSHIPDDGRLVDFIAEMATTEEARQKLLVDNPLRLYWK
jgi:2-pyrone-4,6-dicarboxylate lactonase